MTATQGAMLGVSATVLGVALAFLGHKAWKWMVGFYGLLLRGVRALEGIQAEWAYMRNLTGGTIGGQPGGEDINEARSAAANIPQRQAVPYPEALLDRFPSEPIPDATKEDTDMDLLGQTDRDLAALEVLEDMRKRGIEVEDSDTHHPGITAEV